jgi:hypothetical protein
MSINCYHCHKELTDVHDTTYSNINTARASVGQHTGNIYKCDDEDCEGYSIDNFLTGKVESWSY